MKINNIHKSKEVNLYLNLEKNDKVFLKTTNNNVYYGVVIDNPPKTLPISPFVWLKRKIMWNKKPKHLSFKIHYVNTCSLNY